MLKIAIVGNIASGKSTVEEIIKSNGYKVFDTDKIAHKILETNAQIEKLFGTTNRAELAKIVFLDSEKLKKLESIIHPEVKNELEKIFNLEEKFVFISVPQLFEAGFETLFDKIIYVTAKESIRKERLIKRNNYTPEEAQRRIDAQKEDGKKEKSDFIIDNNNSILELTEQVNNILSILLR